MPYRRLPNTDQARLNSLRAAVEQAEIVGFTHLPFSYRTQNQAADCLRQLEKAMHEYRIAYDRQVASGKDYLLCLRNARLYVSHFIQVLNLSVQRGEIKADMKTLYGLEADNYALPDLSTEPALIQWGKLVVEGEQQRLKRGGSPIYNPSIAKVRVFYDKFIEAQNSKTIFQNNTRRALSKLESLRVEVDALILDIWNQVEQFYKHLPDGERRDKCVQFGLIYYYRKNELLKKNDRDYSD